MTDQSKSALERSEHPATDEQGEARAELKQAYHEGYRDATMEFAPQAGTEHPVGSALTERWTASLDGDEAAALRDLIGSMDSEGEASAITLHCGDGHSGPGLYASITEYPDEGSVLISSATQAATPSRAPAEWTEVDTGCARVISRKSAPASVQDEARYTGGVLPLPEPRHRGPDGTGSYFNAFTADQMHEYAARCMLHAIPAPKAAPAAVSDEQIAEAWKIIKHWGFEEEGKQHSVWRFASHDLSTALRAILALSSPPSVGEPKFSCYLQRDHGKAPCDRDCGKLRCMYPSTPKA